MALSSHTKTIIIECAPVAECIVRIIRQIPDYMVALSEGEYIQPNRIKYSTSNVEGVVRIT